MAQQSANAAAKHSGTPKSQTRITTLKDAIRLLEGGCGKKADKHPTVKGAWFCLLKVDPNGHQPNGKRYLKALERHRLELMPRVQPAGCWVVRSYEPSLGIGLCLLEARDKFDVIKKLGFAGWKWSIPQGEVLKFLRGLDKIASFELVQCGRETMGGRFAKGTQHSARLAQALHKFCPFVATDFDDDLKRLATHIGRGGEVSLWWD